MKTPGGVEEVKEEVEEVKEEVIDNSLGSISLSDLSSRPFRSAREVEFEDPRVAQISNLAHQYEDLEGLMLENDLFTVISYDVVNKEQSK